MNTIEGKNEAPEARIGIVVSEFNRPITEKLEQGALQELERLGVSSQQVTLIRVPGAVEIPLATQWLLDAGADAVATLGCVIRGETSHYDVVCNSVERACTQLMLEHKKPISFGVLTTENKEQAEARAGGPKGNKGSDAIQAILQMLNIQRQMPEVTWNKRISRSLK